MRLFALRLLQRNKSISPGLLRREWRKFWENTDRSLRGNAASRDQFGQISNSYKTCYWLLKNEFCIQEDRRYEVYTLDAATTERILEVLRCQELMSLIKIGIELTPFEAETLKLIQKKYETR